MIASILASTVAFFVASYFIKRWVEDNDIPKGMTRSITIFTLAAALACSVGWLVDHIV
jgi:VIT1/CCC1 family predicted Fe2+/Mn2+ transporter